ncbi:MAG: hypothetical protein IKB51_03955 [Clostridia bacterium]|nr:hypothetical protein [Clostridia bacterium]
MADTTNTNAPISIDIEEYREEIKNKTVANFPHNPSEMGYRAINIKQALYEPIVGGESDTDKEKSAEGNQNEPNSNKPKYSVIDLIDKVINQANAGFGAVQSKANSNEEAIKTLNGDAFTEGSVECKINKAADAINSKLGDVPENQTVIGYIGEVEKNKVDKEEGKGLSTNDFTDTLLTQVENALQKNDISDWAKADAKPTYTANEVGAATSSDIQRAINEVNSEAIGIPMYDEDTGEITFKTLSNSKSMTIDLPIESIVKSGIFDGETLVLTLRNGETLHIPASNLLNPTWTTDIAKATGTQLMTPPTTEAVNNALSEKLNIIPSDDLKGLSGVYVQTWDNKTVLYKVSNRANVGGGSIPVRTTGGNLVVPTDESVLLPDCAVPKSYVDDKLQALINKLTSTAGGAY